MRRKLIAVGLALAFVLPAFAQRRGGNGAGNGSGTQLRQRIHQPGTGQQNGTAVRKRDRKRDGTGMNCPNGPCMQNRTQTQTQTETMMQNQAQGDTQSQVQTQTKTQTRTQQSKPPKQ